MKAIILILIGFAEGAIVGVALVAFLMVLDVIPRLIQCSNSKEYIEFYQILIIIGSLLATLIQFFQVKLPQLYFINKLFLVFIGLIFGIFIGLVAGALTEVLKVLPILSRRLGLKGEKKKLLFIIILGKVFGSIIYWLLPEIW